MDELKAKDIGCSQPYSKLTQRKKKRCISHNTTSSMAMNSMSILAISAIILVTLMIVPSSAQLANDKRLKSPQRNVNIELYASTPNITVPPYIWRESYLGHGTTHEQLGQPHYEPTEYTKYTSHVKYSEIPEKGNKAMRPVFNITQAILKGITIGSETLPPGYVVLKDEDILSLGPKVETNDWAPLLQEFWLLWFFIFLMVLIIIIVPFVAVCYCCFCCCKRCRQGCPPCERQQDARKRCCYGFLLLLFIVGILFGVIIAFVTNKLLERGFNDSTTTFKRGSEDTCTYLQEVSDHIHHLLVNNYQELETHLTDQIRGAYKHIFMDLADVSGANAVEELLRILENMDDALPLMESVNTIEKEMRFFGSQLRDAIRGVKRDVSYAANNLCGTEECLLFLKQSDIENVDFGDCLHFDQVPDSSIFVKDISTIIETHQVDGMRQALQRFGVIGAEIEISLKVIIPPLIQQLNNGREEFRKQASNIRNMVDAIISDVHLNTMRSTKSFEDIYERFGPDRNIINIIVCIVLLFILLLLVIALLFGCCGKRKRGYRDDCCNKGTGATCLFIAILMIFVTFSIITAIGLFYFILGLLSYHGACAPLRDQEKNALFNQLDSGFDLNRYLPTSDEYHIKSRPPFRMSSAMKACEHNITIFEIMRSNSVYDINELRDIEVVSKPSEESSHVVFAEDLSNVVLLTQEEKDKISLLGTYNLSNYHSTKYLNYMCTPFTPVSLRTLASKLRRLANSVEYPLRHFAHISFLNEAYNLETYEAAFVPKLKASYDQLQEKLLQIDDLLLFENRNFSETVRVLNEMIANAEVFLRNKGAHFINLLASNLTVYLVKEVDDYMEGVIETALHDVGRCGPLSYIYYRGVELICERLVDPLNGFWFGVLLCSFLFLPTLIVAHKLMCLYKKIDPYIAPEPAVVEGGEYLYDAYSERDHLPMANVPKKRRKGYDRRREQQEYYEDASPSVSRGTRAESAGSSNHRYNDMAPKHWDHEPPRYHNQPAAPPSSEYERPPPYYYPGASEQD